MYFKKSAVMLICEPCQNIMQKMSDMLTGFESFKKDVEEVKHFMRNIEEKSINRSPEDFRQNIVPSKSYKHAVVNKEREVLLVKPKEKRMLLKQEKP